MIPVMSRMWMPHATGGGFPPGENYPCTTTTELACNFDTDGAINGGNPEVSPSDGWTYSSSSSAADGFLSPADFTVSGDTQAAFSTCYVQAYVASGEAITFDFADAGAIITIRLVLGIGTNASSIAFIYNNPPDTETVSGTFTALASAGTIAVFIEFGSGLINVYVAPDFVNVEQTISQNLNSFPVYLQCRSIDVSSTGTGSAVDYIRICTEGG